MFGSEHYAGFWSFSDFFWELRPVSEQAGQIDFLCCFNFSFFFLLLGFFSFNYLYLPLSCIESSEYMCTSETGKKHFRCFGVSDCINVYMYTVPVLQQQSYTCVCRCGPYWSTVVQQASVLLVNLLSNQHCLHETIVMVELCGKCLLECFGFLFSFSSFFFLYRIALYSVLLLVQMYDESTLNVLDCSGQVLVISSRHAFQLHAWWWK